MHNIDGLVGLFFAIVAGLAIYLIGTLWLMWRFRKDRRKVWMTFACSLVLFLTWAYLVGLIRVGA